MKAPGAAPGKLGANLGFVKGVAWGDYNNDGRPDLYVSTMSGRSFLFRNDGPRDPKHPDPAEWVWTDVTEQAGLAGKRFTFPTWFFDYDNDGWLDIFAGGYATGRNGGRTAPSSSTSRTTPPSPTSSTTTTTAPSPMSPRRWAWIARSPSWPPTSATWTTTAGSMSTSAWASPLISRCCPSRCSATTRANTSRT